MLLNEISDVFRVCAGQGNGIFAGEPGLALVIRRQLVIQEVDMIDAAFSSLSIGGAVARRHS